MWLLILLVTGGLVMNDCNKDNCVVVFLRAREHVYVYIQYYINIIL